MITYLWQAEAMALAPRVIWLLALLAGLWSVGGLTQGRISILQVLLIESAALATASATLGLSGLQQVLKPLPLLLPIVLVASRARPLWAGGRFDLIRYLPQTVGCHCCLEPQSMSPNPCKRRRRHGSRLKAGMTA